MHNTRKKIKPGRVNIVTMGCPKNLVDSENIITRFAASGWKVEFDSSSCGHDIVIVNTCGFIHDAKRESVEKILEYAEARNSGRIGKLIVIGCLSQRYRDELIKEIPEADLFFGVGAIDDICNEFNLKQFECFVNERLISTPAHYAYFKISEGCDRKCSFCAIPAIRGRHISRPAEALLNEAKILASKGVRELILVAQDLTWYGKDMYGDNSLVRLLSELHDIEGIEWIRLQYAFPAGFPDGLLDLIRESKVICNYLDIPFQHISDKMLKMMRRGISRKETFELIEKIRSRVPGIALRTTLMTGHPGETENDFNELKDFVRSVRFERMGVFPYSHEEGTWAFKKYRDNIPFGEKNRRVSELMHIQQEISETINHGKIGQVFQVVIDREDKDFYYGRTEHDSPEIDNEVLVQKTESLNPGDFCRIRITGSSEFDLFGEVCK